MLRLRIVEPPSCLVYFGFESGQLGIDGLHPAWFLLGQTLTSTFDAAADFSGFASLSFVFARDVFPVDFID